MWPGLSTTLTGTRVVLAPLANAHRDGLRAAAAQAGSATFRWMPTDLSSPVAFEAWFGERRRTLADGAEAPFTTMEAGSGRAIGSTSCLTLRPADRSLEIGRTWLEPAAWGSGANVEAKLLLLTHAFETLRCVRVELKTDALNERSRRAISALPAQLEGVHRQHMVRADGTLRDSAYYSVLDHEWPDVQANLRRRLERQPVTRRASSTA